MDTQMAEVLWLIGALLLGLLNCFYGYRLFIVTVAIVGFAIGVAIGYMIGVWTGNFVVGLIVAIVLGLIAGWASVLAYYAFIFVVGAFGFALVAAFVAGLFMPDVSFLVPLIAGFIGGFLAFWLQRVIISIATAAQGALVSVLAVTALIAGGGLGAYQALFYDVLEGDLSRTGGIWFYVGLILWLTLTAAGLTTQFKFGKEMYRGRGSRSADA